MHYKFKINETTDYSKFSLMKTNRIVNKSKVEQLKMSMKVKILPNPIIVNKKFQIVDGQHRFFALVELGAPILYIMIDYASIEDARRLNLNQGNWTERDYIYSYAEEGNKNYKRLQKVMDEFKVSAPIVLHTVHKTARRGVSKENLGVRPIKEGTLKFSDYDVHLAEKSIPKMKELQRILGAKSTNNFNLAAIKVVQNEEYNHERMKKQAEKYKDMFEEQVRVEGYVRLFSKIYNYRRKECVYFEDAIRR